MTHVVRDHGPVDLRHGCDAGAVGCWGPVGEHWTFLGVDVAFLGFHALVAAALALVLAGLVARVTRGSPRQGAWTSGVAAGSFCVLFVALVLWLGGMVSY